jgi:hypothetical protein
MAALDDEARRGGSPMDPLRFDHIARILGTSSRRRMLAGFMTTALAALTPNRAGAACNPGSCNAFFDCGFRTCGNVACEPTFFPAGTECRAAVNECDVAEFCTGDSLSCPADSKRPNGTPCSSDGNICTDDICQNGACVHVPNSAACADDGNPCTDDVCVQGLCLHLTKPSGTTCTDDGNPCTDDVCSGVTCTHPAKPDGTPCPTGTCRGGQCIAPTGATGTTGTCGGAACTGGRLCCGGACIDPASDQQHCGGCGKACRKGRCRNGRCKRRKKHKKKR